MSTNSNNIMSLLKKTFEELGLSTATHNVYMQLLEKGGSTAKQLADWLSIPRTSVYDHLKLLIQKGLVVEQHNEGKKSFAIDDPRNLPNLIDAEIDSLKAERAHLIDILPTLIKNPTSLDPKIRFYSGVEGVRHVLNEFKWQRNAKTMAMWPMSEMHELLGTEFFNDLNRRRIKQNVHVQGIWPHNKTIDVKKNPFIGTGPEFLRELRVAPKDMTWNIGYWIYGDKVAFISSQKEAFGFTIHSKDFSQLMKLQFQTIWNQSKKIKPNRKYTDPWIEQVYREIGKKPPYGKE